MEFSNVFFSGTANDFVKDKIALNGTPLDAVTVNSLAKHGLLAQTGFGAKPVRGRTPRMFSAINREGFTFSKYVEPVVDDATREFFAPAAVIPETVSAETVPVLTEVVAPETVEPQVTTEVETTESVDAGQSAILEAMEAAQAAGINVDYSEEASF